MASLSHTIRIAAIGVGCLISGGQLFASENTTHEDLRPRFNTGSSISPIMGYEPTYGAIFGGAFFRESIQPRWEKWYIVGAGTFQKDFGVEAGYKLWTSNRWIYDFEFDGNNFYDVYFGEGNKGRLSDRTTINNLRLNFYPTLWYRLSKEWSVGLLSEVRYRDEYGVNGQPERQLFPTEMTTVVGLTIENDQRDNPTSPKHGSYHSLTLDAGPPLLSTRETPQWFGRLRQESRFFWTVIDPLQLALQTAIGASVGNPGYQFRFRLGGNKRLRGFEPNRFRGDDYYMVQGETRLQLQRWFGVVWFAGIGDAADTHLSEFGLPKVTGGMGFRIGLPPDYVAKARIDFGASAENTAVYLNFQEAF